MHRSSFALALLVLVAGCHEEDTSHSLREFECEPLLEGTYLACYGPGWAPLHPHDRSRYTCYEVDVLKPQESGNRTVLFSKTFDAAAVIPSLLKQGKADVIRFDQATKKVEFKVTSEEVSFVIQ